MNMDALIAELEEQKKSRARASITLVDDYDRFDWRRMSIDDLEREVASAKARSRRDPFSPVAVWEDRLKERKAELAKEAERKAADIALCHQLRALADDCGKRHSDVSIQLYRLASLIESRKDYKKLIDCIDDVKPAIMFLAAQAESGDESAATDDYVGAAVTMDQAAALCHVKKPTVRYWLDRGKIPQPDFPGGDGKPHRWRYENLRPFLQEQTTIPLPERFPSERFIG